MQSILTLLKDLFQIKTENLKRLKTLSVPPNVLIYVPLKILKQKAIGSLLEIRFQIFCTCFSEAADFLITEITDSISES